MRSLWDYTRERIHETWKITATLGNESSFSCRFSQIIFWRKIKRTSIKKKRNDEAFIKKWKGYQGFLWIAYIISQKLKPHTLAENLILPAFKEVTSIMFSPKEVNELEIIPASMIRSKAESRIWYVYWYFGPSYLRYKKSIYYSLQLDESTDISNQSNLLVYAKYIIGDEIVEIFLFSGQFEANPRGIDIFSLLNHFINQNNLE
jgi:hypothetical protein